MSKKIFFLFFVLATFTSCCLLDVCAGMPIRWSSNIVITILIGVFLLWKGIP